MLAIESDAPKPPAVLPLVGEVPSLPLPAAAAPAQLATTALDAAGDEGDELLQKA
eukprot:SAG25_NODE_3606_length_1025_cov_1.028078_1_plen_54_part_10